MAPNEGSSSEEGSGRPVVVLGAELARAREVERARVEVGTRLPSPIADVRYSIADLDLFRVVEVEADRRIAAFLTATPENLDGLRESLSMDDLYALVGFCRRAGALSLASGRAAPWLNLAIEAAVRIDLRRIDPRDLTWAMQLLVAVGREVGVDFGSQLAAASPRAGTTTSDMLIAVAKQSPRLTFASSGYQLCAIDGVKRLVQSHGTGTSGDLMGVARGIVAMLESDRFEAQVELGTIMPLVWVRGVDDPAAGALLRRTSAAAIATGTERGAVGMDRFRRQVRAWLATFASEVDATALASIANRKAAATPTAGYLVVTKGTMTCILISSPAVQGERSRESSADLSRFSAPLAAALAGQ